MEEGDSMGCVREKEEHWKTVVRWMDEEGWGGGGGIWI